MFLSSFLGKTVVNKSRQKIGNIKDLIITQLNTSLPIVSGFLIKQNDKKECFFIPLSECTNLEGNIIGLTTDIIDFSPFQREGDEVLLSKEVLDKQTVDIKERQLTRINDIEFGISKGNMFLKSVDVSFRSILNRLKIPTKGLFFRYNLIPWKDIQFFGVDLPIKLKMDYDRLETLHPADIARFIFRGPGYRKGTKVIESLDEGIAADVVESLPLDLQVNIISHMSDKNAAELLSEMKSDLSADLLSEMTRRKQATILGLMSKKEAEAVKYLLTYPPGTVGSMMQAEFIYTSRKTTVEQFYTFLRSLEEFPDTLYYCYITENENTKKLVGIVSIWELFKGQNRDKMETIMVKNFIYAKPYEVPKRVLKRMTQYDLSAIPVINKYEHIVGVFTLNDAIKLLIPKTWKTRIGLR